MTERDLARLELILDVALKRSDYDKENARRLSEDLEWASIIEDENIPSDLVTMNSKVCVRDIDSGKKMTFVLVYPEAADLFKGKISVLAPVGSAVLGYRVGDVVEWTVPSGKRRLRIERVLDQPGKRENRKLSRGRLFPTSSKKNRPFHRKSKGDDNEGKPVASQSRHPDA